MIQNRLICLRKQKGWTQEELASRIGVSRQAYGRWENGNAEPDLEHCILLARLYELSLDELVSGRKQIEKTKMPDSLEGKHIFGSVYLNERGQILIPKKARDIFGLQAGDQLILLGDEQEGLALIREELFTSRLNQAMELSSKPVSEN